MLYLQPFESWSALAIEKAASETVIKLGDTDIFEFSLKQPLCLQIHLYLHHH